MRDATVADASAVMSICNTGYAVLRPLWPEPGTLRDLTLVDATNLIANAQTKVRLSVSGVTVLGVFHTRLTGAVFDRTLYTNCSQCLNWFVLPDSTTVKTRTRFRTVSKEMFADNHARNAAADFIFGRLPGTLPTLANEFLNNMAAAAPRIVMDSTRDPGYLSVHYTPADGVLALTGVV